MEPRPPRRGGQSTAVKFAFLSDPPIFNCKVLQPQLKCSDLQSVCLILCVPGLNLPSRWPTNPINYSAEVSLTQMTLIGFF